MHYYHLIDSPIGALLLTGNGEQLTGAYLEVETYLPRLSKSEDWQQEPTLFADAEAQLRAYFASELKVFNLPTQGLGTPFQQQVWNYLSRIPHGSTVSYKTVAEALGSPKAVRAVGSAIGRNPILIIVPCHRVIGANGKLSGYRGGLWRKQWLVNHESGQPLPEPVDTDHEGLAI